MFLGLDLGTSGVRALLVGEDGQTVASADAACETCHPASGQSEQSPEDWISACKSALARLRADHPSTLGAVRAIGVSGQMHGAVLLDHKGRVLRPAILWNDSRSHVEAAKMDADPAARRITGNIVFAGFTAPKLIWLKTHEPEVFNRVATVLLPKDYLNFRLTGVLSTDMSDASGTAWLDVGARVWSEEMLALSHMSRAQMPPLAEGNQVIGAVASAAAAEFGLPKGARVVAGAADNAAVAAGTGTLAEGDGLVSLGTSGVLLAAREIYSPAPDKAVHSFCHAVAGRWIEMGVILSASDSLAWLGRITGRSVPDLAAALGSATGPSDVRFLPYLSGERTPHNDAVIRGAFLGLDVADGPTTLTQAVMEGVAFGLRDCLEGIEATGVHLERLLATGGGARSRFWLESLANILNRPLDIALNGENSAALGAARLAISALGGGPPERVMTRPAICETIFPDPALQPRYEAAYRKFHATYPAIKALK